MGYLVAAGTHYLPVAAGTHYLPVAQRTPMKLVVMRGDSIQVDYQVFGPDGVTPFSLVGAKVYGTIKRQTSDTDAAALSRVDSSGTSTPTGGAVTVTDAANGLVTVRHPTGATTALEAGIGLLVYDVQVRDANGRVFTVDHGTITLVPDCTITQA